MSESVDRDRLVLIRIEGMHCHRCEQTIRKTLAGIPGVHEVEVDFSSGQASVLFNRDTVAPAQLAQAVSQAGYKVTGFSQRDAEQQQQHQPDSKE